MLSLDVLHKKGCPKVDTHVLISLLSQCASNQFLPHPQSATNGTDRG